MNKSYSIAGYNDDMQEIIKSNKVSNDDLDMLTKFIALSRLAGSNLEGKTYDEILDRLKEIKKATGDNSDQIKTQKETKRSRLNPFISVTLLDKKFFTANGQDSFACTVLFKNKSVENIKMIIGSISVNDILEKEIKKIDILLEETVKAKSSLKKTYTINYNHSSENDARLRSQSISDIRSEWNPEKIIFENGHSED